MATIDSRGSSGFLRAPNYRLQTVYGATHFPPTVALLITELRYRPNYFSGHAFTATVANIQFNLSTTLASPEALNSSFASNVGNNETVVFNGALTISSQFAGPPNGPKDFDIIIPLQTPFLYNPAAGNLLIDVRNFSGSSASTVAATNNATDAGSRNGGSLNGSTGAPDFAAEALQIVYTPTNQPPIPPQPIQVLRGPYLQNATISNIIVRWRTSRLTNSVVQFGLSNSVLTWAITNTVLTNDHTVVLTNLAADTKYFYAIGASDTNLAGGPSHFFITAPAIPRSTRIWAMGDFGTTGRYGNGAVEVRDSYYNFASNRYTDVWLMLGDNAYDYGYDHEYQRGVFDVYQNIMRQTVAWSTIGNHETYGSNSLGHIAYYDIFNLPSQGEAGGIPSGTFNYYSFNYGNIHFVCLDSEFSDPTDTGAMATWLREDLTDNTNEWLIAYWHSPPYTKGSHDSDNDADTSGHLKKMREIFVPILESYGVDLVLSGHSHIYERSYLLHGHYGKMPTLQPGMLVDSGDGRTNGTGAYTKLGDAGETKGAVYIVAGSGGFATFATGRHSAMYAHILELGSLVIDVSSNRLDALFLRETGEIEDTFTIIKGPAPLKIEAITLAGGNVTLQLRTTTGKTYRVERATRLTSPDWIPVSSDIVATGSTTAWSEARMAEPGARFYRVVPVP